MNKRQIKAALKKANLTEGIEVHPDNEVEVFVESVVEGVADEAKTEVLANKVENILGWGGYKTGYGSWCYQEDYAVDTSDYCDVSSPMHY